MISHPPIHMYNDIHLGKYYIVYNEITSTDPLIRKKLWSFFTSLLFWQYFEICPALKPICSAVIVCGCCSIYPWGSIVSKSALGPATLAEQCNSIMSLTDRQTVQIHVCMCVCVSVRCPIAPGKKMFLPGIILTSSSSPLPSFVLAAFLVSAQGSGLDFAPHHPPWPPPWFCWQGPTHHEIMPFQRDRG